MDTVEYIPAEWLERGAWAASRGEPLMVYSRPVQIERRHVIRRSEVRYDAGRREADASVPCFQSLNLAELALV